MILLYSIRFESNVILDRYKTFYIFERLDNLFESNVILDRYKTCILGIYTAGMFESNVILDRYKTNYYFEIVNACV